MAFKKLPTFYYHTHFIEFLDFVRGPSAALLNQRHQQFLQRFDSLSHLEQCLVVRLINRKYSVVKTASLKFEEIPNIERVTRSIIDKGFAVCPAQLLSFDHTDTISKSSASCSNGNESNSKKTSRHESKTNTSNVKEINACAQQVLSTMTKPELYNIYQECAAPNLQALPKSASKAAYSEQCEQLDPYKVMTSKAAQGYIIRQTDEHVDYFLFLYFGHAYGALSQFSMRDLGIMRTREQQAQMQSRFIDYDSAYSTFILQRILHNVKQQTFCNTSDINSIINELPAAYGAQAEDYEQRIRFALGQAKMTFSPTAALNEIANIENPKAQEYWCRQAYKLDMKEEVEERLNSIIDNPLSDRLLQFAEDFLARKYHKKRTSILTDMLRQNTRHLALDETYKGSVERGVVAYYQARGIQAWRTENYLWQNLFGLCFWPELFELDGLGLATPFDYLPLCIKQHCFLEVAGEQIHQRLNQIQSNKALVLLLTKHCTQYFGRGQGMVHWHPTILDNLITLVEHSSLEAIKQHLLTMCSNWTLYNDGYPDIMVLENNKLRFEEIKAQGDSLRRNQLMQIQGLKQCGFDVGITTVDWTLDPMQPYAVIDIETTGGRAGTHKITEIGMVKIVNGEVVDEWQSLINPERRIPSMITNLTGIDNEMVADAPLFVDIADQVDQFTENCIFVAHNVNFDYGFIREEFARINRPFKRPKLCTVQQMRKHYKGLKSYSLANLTRHFDISMDQHHRALSDAIAASELLKLVNEARMQG